MIVTGMESLHSLATGALVMTGILTLGWLFSFISDVVAHRQQRRAARIEAELDATAKELQHTILSLAEAIATERSAADSASRDMQHIAQLAQGK